MLHCEGFRFRPTLDLAGLALGTSIAAIVNAAALAWLWLNRGVVRIDDARWDAVRRDVCAISRARFAGEGKAFDDAWLDAERVRGLV